MAFSDDDIKRLKENMKGLSWPLMDRLLARLEAAEAYIEAIQTLFAKANAAYEKPADDALNAWRQSAGKSQ